MKAGYRLFARPDVGHGLDVAVGKGSVEGFIRE
jgi:hypothetical protein